MSLTQEKVPDFPRSVVYGSTGPTLGRTNYVSSRDIDRCEQTVAAGKITGTIGPVVTYLINEVGLSSKGLLGCVLVPNGDETITCKGKTYQVVDRVVPVWVIQGRERKVFLSSSKFCTWMSQKEVPSEIDRGSTRRVPLSSSGAPEFRRSRSTLRDPLPPVSEEDSVSQWGDISPEYRSPLSRAEAEFRSTPRVLDDKGNQTFDSDEYIHRIDILDAARISAGLRATKDGMTPSVYNRYD
jgi:hypothetical protein